ncbi:M23 family metallopeptidase [Leucobacter komagatae]|nr:M23 family metallopeptidase [Leucobacter komagatae]
MSATMRAVVLALYRIRGLLFAAAAAVLLVNVIVLQFTLPRSASRSWAIIVGAAILAMILSMVLSSLVPKRIPEALRSPSTVVRSPVAGRWFALNSPATQVPSHGTRAFGQAYAIDLIHEPAGSTPPPFGETAMRAPDEYSTFGQPVYAMINGTVVRASDWRRDHRARSNTLAFWYLTIEGMLRQLGGTGLVVGNHVTIRGADGAYAAVAHLKQGSVEVSVGDRVTAGMTIGACGNSGNSSEPHVHAQLMDRASFWTAQGVPMEFAGVTLEGQASGENGAGAADRLATELPDSALPGTGQYMVAAPG